MFLLPFSWFVDLRVLNVSCTFFILNIICSSICHRSVHWNRIQTEVKLLNKISPSVDDQQVIPVRTVPGGTCTGQISYATFAYTLVKNLTNAQSVLIDAVSILL